MILKALWPHLIRQLSHQHLNANSLTLDTEFPRLALLIHAPYGIARMVEMVIFIQLITTETN